MAVEIRRFGVLTPAGTAITSPQTTNLVMPARIVESIRVRIPPGPAGQCGVAIFAGGGQVIPYQSGTYIVGDDEELPWQLDNFPDSGDWSVMSYNAGSYDHTIYFDFMLQPLTQVQVTTQPITSVQLAQV